MNNYRRRLLVYFNAQPSSVIIDPTIQDVPNGVYIEDTDGILYSKSAWPTSGVTPNSVVLITNECKIRLSLLNLDLTFFGFSKDDNAASFMDDKNLTEAKNDYAGKLNTETIFEHAYNAENCAAGVCLNFLFPDGVTKGYLPAFGEAWALFQNKTKIDDCLSACGGDAMITVYNSAYESYWTSTLFYASDSADIRPNKAYVLYWSGLKNGYGYSSTYPTSDSSYYIVPKHYVRPVAEYKPIAKDLSMVSGVMNTANCYMVHEAGTYRIPLVYGNAIKNGQDNQVAYKPGGTTTETYCANFVNHNDDPIAAPWITKSGTGVNGGMGITVDSAQLIWQDVNNLTTNYSIEGDYLTFEIPSFVEGNAVIAVKSGDTIVWSWHIWVTSEDYSDLVTINPGGEPNNFGTTDYECKVPKCNLGWVSTSQDKKQGRNPYYLWGRKDPFAPLIGTDGVDRTVQVGDLSYGHYYGSPYVLRIGRGHVNGTFTIGYTIQHPWNTTYNNSSYLGVTNTHYNNMWDVNNNNNFGAYDGHVPVKTIYDPCPYGFCVPVLLFSFELQNSNFGTYTWDSTNKGITWSSTTNDELWFPAAGWIYLGYGAERDVNTQGRYWMSNTYKDNTTSGTSHDGKVLYFSESAFSYSSNMGSYSCMPIRPVAEE